MFGNSILDWYIEQRQEYKDLTNDAVKKALKK